MAEHDLVWILAALLALAALALLWLGWDEWRQARRLALVEERNSALEHLTREQQQRLLDLEDARRALESRQDRLQKLVEGRGWGDSLDFTKFNWAKPGQF